jgi:hypothetical protein
MPEIYVSTDIEADGPIPGIYSMLSFGSAAYRPDKTLHGAFTANLEQLPGASTHPDTMAWWAKRPQEWAASRRDLQKPEAAMPAYCAWLKELPGTPVFVGYPAVFDFSFIYWYLMRFVGESPFGHRGLDIRTYAMAVMKTEFYKAGKHDMPKRWFDNLPHTHHALDDALEQGALFCNILHENKK